MDIKGIGTIKGKPISEKMLNSVVSEFESDWDESAITVCSTSYGKVLDALQTLELPIDEIEALERRAKHEKKPFSLYIRSILQSELAG